MTNFDNKTRVLESSDSRTSLVPALDRTLDILELLSSSGTKLTLSAISESLDAPKNAVFRITQSLLSRGYLERDEKTLEFGLTAKWLRLTPASLQRFNLLEVSTPVMNALRDQTRETVQLGVLSGDEGVIVGQVEGLEPLRIVADIGLHFKLYNNAPGKLLLAHQPISLRQTLVETMELVPSTTRTITDSKSLSLECERILDLGYAVDHAESNEGIHCIAVPIFGHGDGNPIAGTIWISGPSRRLPKSRFPEFGQKVQSAGLEISTRISGYFS